MWLTMLLTLCLFTRWGRVTHICVSKQTIIGSDKGMSRGRRQTVIWTNAGILSIGPLGTNFSENLNEILTFSFKKMPLKVSSVKWRPFCLGHNVLMAEVKELIEHVLLLYNKSHAGAFIFMGIYWKFEFLPWFCYVMKLKANKKY